MLSRTQLLSGDVSNVGYIIAGIITVRFLVKKWIQRPRLDAIPTVGSSTWLGSWWAGFTFTVNGNKVVQEGYNKYKSRPFKVADYYRWMVIVSSREHIEELRRASDDDLSLSEAINERLHLEHIIDTRIRRNPYHVALILSKLTRTLEVLCPEMKDEVNSALEDALDLKGNEWKSVTALDLVRKVVFRSNNRCFVGLPLCRNPEWMSLNVRYMFDLIAAGLMLEFFPTVLAPYVARFFSFVPRTVGKAMNLLGPVIEERQKHLDQEGSNWAGKPNDFVSWMMDEAEGEERGLRLLTVRIMGVNFAALHTSSNSFTQALFYLAAYPQYIPILREEVETIVKEEGWTKASLGKMHKIDSFLKESQRIKGFTGEALTRKAMKDYTFSDGTFIPKGTMITVASRCLHLDDELYENAGVFDPFRFSKMREKEGEAANKHQFVSTGTDYLTFGYGRHACPGRFFASCVLTMMLAQIVCSYDIKLENETLPDTLNIGTNMFANSKAKVMFRRRVPSS